jgi:hypothetical protein
MHIELQPHIGKSVRKGRRTAVELDQYEVMLIEQFAGRTVRKRIGYLGKKLDAPLILIEKFSPAETAQIAAEVARLKGEGTAVPRVAQTPGLVDPPQED